MFYKWWHCWPISMQYVTGGEIIDTNRAYHIWRWMSAIVSHFKWCHRWLITDQDTNPSPQNNACYRVPVICISCAQSEHSWLIMLDKGHCWSANNISVWTDLSTNLLPVVKGPSTSNHPVETSVVSFSLYHWMRWGLFHLIEHPSPRDSQLSAPPLNFKLCPKLWKWYM